MVRSGKGDKDRRTILPESLKDDLINHLSYVRTLYDQDRERDINGVYLPGALEKKYPNAGKEWDWFWFFLPSRYPYMVYLCTICIGKYNRYYLLRSRQKNNER